MRKRADSVEWCLEHCETMRKRCPACTEGMEFDSYTITKGMHNFVFTAKFWCQACAFYSHISFDLQLSPLEELALGAEIDQS